MSPMTVGHHTVFAPRCLVDIRVNFPSSSVLRKWVCRPETDTARNTVFQKPAAFILEIRRVLHAGEAQLAVSDWCIPVPLYYDICRRTGIQLDFIHKTQQSYTVRLPILFVVVFVFYETVVSVFVLYVCVER